MIIVNHEYIFYVGMNIDMYVYVLCNLKAINSCEEKEQKVQVLFQRIFGIPSHTMLHNRQLKACLSLSKHTYEMFILSRSTLFIY